MASELGYFVVKYIIIFLFFAIFIYFVYINFKELREKVKANSNYNKKLKDKSKPEINKSPITPFLIFLMFILLVFILFFVLLSLK
mgnify:CR=1 FL=1